MSEYDITYMETVDEIHKKKDLIDTMVYRSWLIHTLKERAGYGYLDGRFY